MLWDRLGPKGSWIWGANRQTCAMAASEGIWEEDLEELALGRVRELALTLVANIYSKANQSRVVGVWG